MIEYILVFALGFLAAVLLALLVTPSIHARIVTLTERRIRASEPVTAAEMRAETGAAKARFAVELARAGETLHRKEEALASLKLRQELLQRELSSQRGENEDLHRQIEQLQGEASDMRGKIRAAGQHIDSLRHALASSERSAMARDNQISGLGEELNRVGARYQSLKIEIATRDAELESLRSQIRVFREERSMLRSQAEAAANAQKEVQLRLDREKLRARSLDAKLSETVARLSDGEMALDQKSAEIRRLHERLQASVVPAMPKDDGEKVPAEREEVVNEMRSAGNGADGPDTAEEKTRRINDSYASLVERLTAAEDDRQDGELRDEIANIAAMMVEWTMIKEGALSPVAGLLDVEDRDTAGPRRESLARRAKARLESEHGTHPPSP